MHFQKMHPKIPQLTFMIAHMMLIMCDLINAHSQKPFDTVVVEYYKDHEVTEKQAREALKLMKEDEFQQPAHCRPCTNEQQRYCRSSDLLKDHCCCNQSHKKEQLYFIPHECYINSERCFPSLGSCLTVMYIRNCCCDAQLKKQWKSELASNGRMIQSTRCHWILVTTVLLISSFYS